MIFFSRIKKVNIVFLMLSVVLAFAACGNEGRNYNNYNGSWSLDGNGYDFVLANGGALLTCHISEEGDFNGSLYTQQGMTERFAEIDILGKIDDAQLKYYFEDDGWGGSGTLFLSFKDAGITAWVEDYRMADDNSSGYGISGTYEFIKCTGNSDRTEDIGGPGDTDKAEDELAEMNERSQYYQASGYYEEVVEYWENVRGVTDIANLTEPLYKTDEQFYEANDFAGVPGLIIHLAKNEIYARHGYVFQNEDLYNYFMGCLWYQPIQNAGPFDDSVFNEYEKKNLQLLSELDKYKE